MRELESATAATTTNETVATNRIWINGALVDEASAYISPFDHGLLTGDGVFESVKSYSGKVFGMTRHYRRLKNSAKGLALDVPPLEVLSDAIDQVLAANGLSEGRIRITLTGGKSPLGSEKGQEQHTVIVAATTIPVRADQAKVVRVPYCRNERGALVGMKTTSYGENVAALAYAKERGGSEAIFGNTRGELCEGTGTNIFFVKDGKLMTPPLSVGCLAGVTRSAVLDVCAHEGIEVSEETIPLEELTNVDEAFLTSTYREVQPIAEVDGQPLGSCPGEYAPRLWEGFKALVARDIDPQ